MNSKPSSNIVLCAGRLYCDLVFTGVPNLPEMGTETFCDGLSLHAGGGAFITAAAFSALGWNTSLLAMLPAAPFDQVVCDDIARSGVETIYCQAAAPASAPQLTVAITGKDDRAFLSHKTGVALPDIAFPQNTFRHLHVGELRSLVEHPDLIEKARDAGMTISVDCGWDTGLLARGAEMNDLLSMVDVFLPNESEFEMLIASGLNENSICLAVVKSGSKGARALENGKWIAEPAIHANVVDTTGAGDAFNGGFLSSWLSGKPLANCLIDGNRCGAASVEQTGGTGGISQLRSELSAVNAGVAE